MAGGGQVSDAIESCAIGIGSLYGHVVNPADQLKGEPRRAYDAMLRCADEQGKQDGAVISFSLEGWRRAYYAAKKAVSPDAKTDSIGRTFGRVKDDLINEGLIKVIGEVCQIKVDNPDLTVRRICE